MPPKKAAAAAAAADGEKLKRCPKGTRRVGKDCVPNAPPQPQPPTPIKETAAAPARKTIKKRVKLDIAAPAPQKTPPPPPTPIKETIAAADAPPAAAPEEARKQKLAAERAEYEAARTDTSFDFLYPHVNDPNFNTRIATKKEFRDYTYDGTIYDIKKRADELCDAEFELSPHQLFVRNFMSAQTPYQSLLLYHGLGTGKTCSAIGITEEMREILKQSGSTQKIIVIASPNVQANFQKELFNDARLVERDGLWYLNTCIGMKLIKEVNPTNIKNIPREKIASLIQSLIKNYYVFMGYIEFANYVVNHTQISGVDDEKKRRYEKQQLRKLFNGRMIVIDEVHNVRITEENKKKSIGMHLFHIARVCQNVRLLLLTATPMYNSYTEIIWLANLLNANDKRPLLKAADVFHLKTGEFREATGAAEGGRELLIRKLTGYVSYVRGENPYTFPFRLYPPDFAAPEFYFGGGAQKYPTKQMNGRAIVEPLQFIRVYSTKIHPTQEMGYKFILNSVKKVDDEVFQQKESFGYGQIQAPLEALNIIYPFDPATLTTAAVAASENSVSVSISSEESDVSVKISANSAALIGTRGLSRLMTWEEVGGSAPERHRFEYKKQTVETYGRFLAPAHIQEYSHKIAAICETIRRGEGIVMIYSNNIDGGLVPLALALEEMGFSRFSTTKENCSLFKQPPIEPIDALTQQSYSEWKRAAAAAEGAPAFRPARYVMITGEKSFSKNNADDIKYITAPENAHGERVKVILISRAAFEGLDFKFVRQLHVMDAWYNMSRIEQIIGRAVRNLSHCALPFEERNVEIYLHTTTLAATPDEEAVDLYLYRFAEKKARQIGRITRLLKETAADCLLHIGQNNMTVQNMRARAENQNVSIMTSTRREPLVFRVGDKPQTELCDYMEDCQYKCHAAAAPREVDARTFDEAFLETNKAMVMKRIRQLYREQSVYSRQSIIQNIHLVRYYPTEQIFAALNAFLYENEYLVDRLGRTGRLVNQGAYYLFQPLEITDEAATVFERSAAVDLKREKLLLQTVPAAADEDGAVAPEKRDVAAAAAAVDGDIITELRESVEFYKTTKTISPKELNWYKHAGVIREMARKVGVPTEEMDDFVIEHFLDVYPDKVALVSYFLGRRGGAADALEALVQQKIDDKYYVAAGRRVGYFIHLGNVWALYVIERDGTLQPAIDTDIMDFEGAINEKFKFSRASYNKIVGFINLRDEKAAAGGELVFRIKKMDQKKNNKGNFCANGSGKGDLVREINEILGGEYVEDIKQIVKPSYCCLAEFILRYFTKTRRDGKVWFLTPEQAAKNRIKDI